VDQLPLLGRQILDVTRGAHETAFLRGKPNKDKRVLARPALERLVERWQQGCAAPVVDDSSSLLHKIGVTSDCNYRVRLAGQGADYIPKILVYPLLLGRTAGVTKKTDYGGLPLPERDGATFQAAPHQRFVGEVHDQGIGKTKGGEERDDDRRSRGCAGQSSI